MLAFLPMTSSRGIGQGFAFARLASGFSSIRRCLRLSRFGFGQHQIAAAGITKLNILSLHQGIDRADRQSHVEAGANLIANESNPFLASGNQTVVVSENRLWHVRSQFVSLGLIVLLGGFGEIESLELEEVGQKIVHKEKAC